MGQYTEQVQQAILTAPDLSSVSGYLYFVLICVPTLLGIFFTWAHMTRIKKLSVSETNTLPTARWQYRVATLLGIWWGGFFTWGLQELGELLLNLPPLTLKSCFVTGVIVGFSNPFIYDWVRAVGAKTDKKWLRALARVLTVKTRSVDGSVGESGDITTMILNDDDITEERD